MEISVNIKGLSINEKELGKFCEEHDILFLGVFGSYARGDFNAHSDVDLLVRFSQPKTLFQLVDIEDMLSQMLGRKVDLLTEKSISPYLIEKVKKELVPLRDAA